MFDEFVSFVRELYQTDDYIPLHAPVFNGNEKKYLLDAIDSSFVSSVGKCVESLERQIADVTGTRYAVATVNGTAALHVALLVAGVSRGDDVLTQALTFVATCNAIRYCGADPVFVDVDIASLGMSSDALASYLDENIEMREDCAWNRSTGRRIGACVPMHTFGHPQKIDSIIDICDRYRIPVIEDAAESLGSTWKSRHTGSFGTLGVLSFNGNKIITTGGGGMILTDDESLAGRARHLTTTARVSHDWNYEHDELGFNYRMPNLNAALGIAQLEQLGKFIDNKREVAERYIEWSGKYGLQIVVEPEGARSNYWLNALVLKDRNERDSFLQATNENGVMSRPVWMPMHRLQMHEACHAGPLKHTEWVVDRVVNVPSSVCGSLGL